MNRFSHEAIRPCISIREKPSSVLKLYEIVLFFEKSGQCSPSYKSRLVSLFMNFGIFCSRFKNRIVKDGLSSMVEEVKIADSA
ncbi:hypothetical protein [Thermosulfurimonas sp. F29]|uniref:hypothetical protein n=1 Tax=Thermosulfurimonas sp. F29 TaxID=2867247 RepID=UPI001C83569A|nr:hypothetical protein [Thermosulfurimonas sp. F29]MBX6422596.1 hypothetical protein [Thermosulfurimonas sp. F29]